MVDIQRFFKELSGIFAAGQQEKVAEFLYKYLAEAENTGDTNAVITILNEMVGYFRTVSRFNESIRFGERAIALMRELGYSDSIAFGTTLLNTATAYHASGNNQKAEALYEQVQTIYEAELPASDKRLSGLYNNMGSVYLATAQHAKALRVLQKALEIMQSGTKVHGESATVYTNLALALLGLDKKAEAKQVLQAAITIFAEKSVGKQRIDPHYAAALSAQGQVYYSMQEYEQAVTSYEAALEHIQACYGRNKDYALTCDNCALAYAALGNQRAVEEYRQIAHDTRVALTNGVASNQQASVPLSGMVQAQQQAGQLNGMALARAFYAEYGKAMLHKQFPDYVSRIAVGLAGEGSECFGFDDTISTNHDFGPCFCLWLTRDDYSAIGASLQQAYRRLPGLFMGMPVRESGPMTQGRIGAICFDDFFRNHIGRVDAPVTLRDWLRIPESRLATVTNGQVFADPLGQFSAIRQTLQGFYPEDVRLKKIAARAATMGQSGQYNFARSMARKDTVAANLALSEFIKNTASMVYLLNKRYMPFYKWILRGMWDLPLLGSQIAPLLQRLTSSALDVQVWQHEDPRVWSTRLNLHDSHIACIEEICTLVKMHLQQIGLTSCHDDFMTSHADYIVKNIVDNDIRSMHIMEG